MRAWAEPKRLPNPALPGLEREGAVQRPQNPEERMAWETPYSEGSAIRSTGYDPSDVVDISFTVAPEFNQILTVQPDGYVMLKDAGMVEAKG